jgi:hypothetical protein
MSYFPPYLRVATISLLNLPTLLFRWSRGVESRFLAWSWRWLFGWPLHRSMPMKAHATHSFLLQWCIFFRPMGHCVRDNYFVLSNMAPVYHIVVVRVIWTSWAHVCRLCFRFLRTGYDSVRTRRVWGECKVKLVLLRRRCRLQGKIWWLNKMQLRDRKTKLNKCLK